MKRKLLALVLTVTLAATTFAGCGSNTTKEPTTDPTKAAVKEEVKATDTPVTEEKEDVSLVMWGAEEDQAMLQGMIDSFIATYSNKANFDIQLGVQSESTAKDTVLTDVEAAADVYAFADDQLNELVNAGALQPISINTDAIIEANGGAEAGSVKAATKDGTLYAYPMTADNGYFMFYNKEFFTDSDVQSLDKMMEIAAAAGKKITVDYSSGWYLFSFFQGAGLTLGLNEDGVTNYCTWNATDTKYTGAQVADAIISIAKNPGFISVSDAEFATGITEGTIIAGVNGTWNAATAEAAWGDNYAATKLPTYTVAGDQTQMSSFAGYKLVGVNAYSEYAGWAMLLAEWITNYDNQVLRFETRGLGPSNIEAGASDAVQASPAIAALAEQSIYATVQRVGGKFWDPATAFGTIAAAGNADGIDLQVLVDTMVEGIIAPVE